MIRSRLFVFLAIALFLAVCLSAEAEEVANQKTASDRVNALQELTARVLAKAQTKVRGAQSAKTTAGDHKRKAESAEADAKNAAEEIKAGNRKTEADAVAVKAKEELTNCQKLYDAAKDKAEAALNSLNDFVSRAKALDNKAKTELPAALRQQDKYAQVIQDAATATSETTTLSGEINASTVLSAADAAVFDLRDSARKVQMLKYQAESLLIVYRIETKLKTAETDIQSIQQNKEKTDIIVQEMDKTFQSAPNSLKSFFNSLCTNAEGFLRTAKSKVTEADKCNTDMQGEKTQLDGTLETLKATDDETKAGKEVETVKWHATYIDQQLQKIKEALQTAEYAFNSAKNVQKQMRNEMDKYNSPSGTKLNEDKQQDNVPTEEVTTPIRNAEEQTPVIPDTEKPTVTKADKPEITNTDKPVIPKTPKPTLTKTERPAKTETDKPEITETDKPEITETDKPEITETDKAVLGKSEDTMDQTSEQPVDANLDSTEENKSVQLTDKAKQNPKDDNSELLNKDMLRKMTKDITNNSLIGGEVPTWSAANDSAVTVFIPLLVIVVISAVLH